MVTEAPPNRVLVLCADEPLRDSLGELLVADGRSVDFDASLTQPLIPAVVVAAWDAWPAGWSLARLRSGFARVPCLMLSGSPLAGDFAVAQLPRGYFLRLPALPDEITGVIAELSSA